ncbi:hypothetical protein CLF_112297 [Clonorchis sinensis]|uniref:Uncharacterized protein n=1 Tax=Clonorchis sinensis TaxID=79923 RepID=H2KT79_CLOSI|nr:hypothetical protein CLF_112297 [Clonorchis sinensis]
MPAILVRLALRSTSFAQYKPRPINRPLQPNDSFPKENMHYQPAYPASQDLLPQYGILKDEDVDKELGPQSDCCLASSDPLLYGPGKVDCIVATVFLVTFILCILVGTLLTLFHYVAGIEFNTINRGRVVGPVLIGLSPVPLLFLIFFACRAREKISTQVERMKATQSAREQIAYRQYQMTFGCRRSLMQQFELEVRQNLRE